MDDHVDQAVFFEKFGSLKSFRQILVSCFFNHAWSGETDVAEIAVSTDGGRTWAEAEFLDPVRRHAWRRWKFDWLTPTEPGQYTLLARAKDASGLIQPDKHDKNFGTYVINHPLPIEVFVDGSAGQRP